jgi:hypothetical protein
MRVYEWGFWCAMGLIAMTGVGNLGAFGANLPEPSTDWGRRLAMKLAVVMLLLALSGLRTLMLILARASEAPSAGLRALGGLYGATVVLTAAVIGMAVALAHFPAL